MLILSCSLISLFFATNLIHIYSSTFPLGQTLSAIVASTGETTGNDKKYNLAWSGVLFDVHDRTSRFEHGIHEDRRAYVSADRTLRILPVL